MPLRSLSISALLLMVASFGSIAGSAIPTWTFPIFGSNHIGSNCSVETNHVLMELTFSRQGYVRDIVLLHKSRIPAINEEAVRYIMEASPFMEFEGMTDLEAIEYQRVLMDYTIPCEMDNE